MDGTPNPTQDDPGPDPDRGAGNEPSGSGQAFTPPEPPAEAATVAALRKEKGRDSRRIHDSRRLAEELLDSRADTVITNDGELLLGGDENGIPLRNLGHLGPGESKEPKTEAERQATLALMQDAYELVQSHAARFAATTQGQSSATNHDAAAPSGLHHEYRGSVLSELLKLYKQPAHLIGQQQQQHQSQGQHSRSASAGGQSSGSGGATPNRRKWYEQNRSQETLSNLIEAASRLSHLWHKEEEARITVHIAETLARQGYIIKLCRALMLFGAPTHRLEEYLSMSARVLEIDGQFLYLPGCMIISFDDRSTHTTEVRIVRTSQGIDLGRLKDVHHVYKEVMHDVIGADEGTERLDALMESKEKFNRWLRVIVFGLTSVTAAPFSFKARLIDLPPPSVQQRLRGHRHGGGRHRHAVAGILCFVLGPGAAVPRHRARLHPHRLRHHLLPSSLGFGITVGAALYGLFDINAASETTCLNPPSPYYGFIFVPFFVMCISVLYQAKWRQMPVMVTIASAGYIVNYFSSIKFSASPQIASTLGAFSVGVLANLYSRLRHGVAAATLIPAIFTQVPGGLASTGGLLSGIYTANELTKSNQTVTNVNGTVSYQPGQPLDSVIFQVAASMIQIAIGIAVGLFMSACIIYPLGKRRSGLFSF
ncbi:hypothetical protein ACCO45_004218 [Purpureocillium lilacinum]|uniref:Uncharacterized protein n=1 Tax=Purpureocillium lilacinum TaxID=33203 RepID=A0ACC4E245_PURLI